MCDLSPLPLPSVDGDKHLIGMIVAAHGRHYVVEINKNALEPKRFQCFARGKKSEIAVGDEVIVDQHTSDQAIINEILPRRNLIYRSDAFKSKLLAANIDQIVFVIATAPSFCENLLGRVLIAAKAEDIPVIIVLNKSDLLESLQKTRERFKPFEKFCHAFFELSAIKSPITTIAQLKPILLQKKTLLLGQSGMGKSTLLNLLIPNAAAKTREISTALKTGKHTTTLTSLYTLADGGALIDSPGFQSFGLYHLPENTLLYVFNEFIPFLEHCRFYNCRHINEAGCGVLKAVNEGGIAAQRHQLYLSLLEELKEKKY